MSTLYEYRWIMVSPRSWPRVVEEIGGSCRDKILGSGGGFFGLFTGQIGMASNEGVLITTWPDPETQARHAGAGVADIDDVMDSRVARLRLRARDEDPEPPAGPGIYAHRWFEIDAKDRAEFVELSREAWPDFEASHDANIVGLFETLDPELSNTRLLLLTRYASLAVWERSRSAQTEREAQAWKRFVRRHELTLSTIVATTLLAGVPERG